MEQVYKNIREVKELSVLIIEDDLVDAKAIRRCLAECDIKISHTEHCQSLEAAQQKIEGANFDIILLDLNIADSSGLETVQRVKAFSKHIPVVILSGYLDSDLALQALQEGAQDYINKNNIRTGDLQKIIRYSVERERLLYLAREAEKAAKRHSEFKSRFLSQMSHEIRTPMNGVIGLTDILRNSKNLSAEERDIVNTIASCGQNLTEMISDILDMSKIESGKFKIEYKDCNIRDLIKDTLNVFYQRAVDKNLTLASTIDPNVPSQVRVDPTRLTQILSNLVGNAVKYTEQGQIQVKAHCKQQEGGKFILLFKIIDTGPGIDNELQQRLFKEYEQGNVIAYNTEMRGTGLGLSICKAFVEKLGGQIGVISNHGHGSTFWFKLEVEAKTDLKLNRANFKDQKVLLISKSPARTEILKAQLSFKNMTVYHLTDYRNTSSLLNMVDLKDENVIDLVVFDTWEEETSHIKNMLQIAEKDSAIAAAPILILAKKGQENDLHSPLAWRSMTGNLHQSALYENIAQLLNKQPATETPIHTHTARGANLGLRVLVVDDHEVNRRVAIKMLDILKCTTLEADSGQAALNILSKHAVDLVLMDCHMPGMDGFEATKAIRAAQAGYSKIPIIALTADVNVETQKKCTAAGMCHYMTKPMCIDDLKQSLTTINQGKNMTKQNLNTTTESQDLPQLQGDILNHKTLSVLRDLQDPNEDDSFLEDLVNTFVQEVPTIISSLSQALDKKNAADIKHFSHKLKGLSRNLGVNRLTDICSHIEHHAQNYATEDNENPIAQMKVEFEKAREKLDDFVMKCGA